MSKNLASLRAMDSREFSPYLAELIGSTLLSVSIGLGVSTATYPAVTNGVMFGALNYSFAPISGGHFNPAITVSAYLCGILEQTAAAMYIVAQVCGYFIGACVAQIILPSELGAPGPGSGHSVTSAFCAELIFTFLLVFVFLNVAVADAVQPNSYYGLAIGMVITAANFAAASISGAVFNPAMAAGLALREAFSQPACLSTLWLYILGPMLGCTLASGTFYLMEDMSVTPRAKGRGSNVAAALSEFMGAAFFATVTSLSVQQTEFRAVPAGCVLVALVFTGQQWSGSHFNPAVTTAVWLRGNLSSATAFLYIVVQLFGSLLGTLLAAAFTHASPVARPGPIYTQLGAMMAEMVFTTIVIVVFLSVTTVDTDHHNSYYGLAVGFCFMASSMCAEAVSGGVLNPAFATGLAMVDLMFNSSDSLDDLWIYWAGPLLGSGGASLVFRFVFQDEFVSAARPEHSNYSEIAYLGP